MLGQEVPLRAEVLRVLFAELTRIMNHFWAIGFLLNDLGAFFTPSLYAITERELILDLIGSDRRLAADAELCALWWGFAFDLPPYVGGPAIKPGDRARQLRDDGLT